MNLFFISVISNRFTYCNYTSLHSLIHPNIPFCPEFYYLCSFQFFLYSCFSFKPKYLLQCFSYGKFLTKKNPLELSFILKCSSIFLFTSLFCYHFNSLFLCFHNFLRITLVNFSSICIYL